MLLPLLFSNQRATVRRALRLPCQIVRQRDFRLVARKALDVSVDGMLVLAEDDVLTGEEVIVTFQGPRTGTWFDRMGTVARVVHGRRVRDRGVCLGVVFDEDDPVDRLLLRANLRGLPPPLPARRRARLGDRLDLSPVPQRVEVLS